MILPIVIVTIDGANPSIFRDVNVTNEIYNRETGIFVTIESSFTVNRPDLLVLTQTDCRGSGHVVSTEEDELFDFGRNLGVDIVGYYIQMDVSGFLGCAAHPFNRRGFWVGDGAVDFDFVLAHELTHVVGNNPHVTDTDNLMYPYVNVVTNLPADLNGAQRLSILNDPALLNIPSIVLNL